MSYTDAVSFVYLILTVGFNLNVNPPEAHKYENNLVKDMLV